MFSNRNFYLKPYLLFMLMMNALATQADTHTLTFSEVWKQIKENSLAQEGARLKVQSVEEGLSRVEKHWLPKIYLDWRTYRTNDPGSAFVGLLEQRKLEANDFGVDSLNHPDAQSFSRGALGIDLALYEGGSKKSQVRLYQHKLSAEKLNSSQIELEQYAQSGKAYGSIVIIQKQKIKLHYLNEEIHKLIREYRLGQKSNPVGYSGLLGMKSLANRISGVMEQMDAQERMAYHILKEMGVEDSHWLPILTSDVRSFVDQNLTDRQRDTDKEDLSFKSLAAQEMSQAESQMTQMERARYLPKVGLFAESYVFNGNRDNANGYTAGVYLQWSLFDPNNYGKYSEAQWNALSTKKLTQASIQQENAERENFKESERSLRLNLARLDESEQLLSEQVRVSFTLFKNGSINILQFVEILNRRMDLIAQQWEAEGELLKIASEKIMRSKINLN